MQGYIAVFALLALATCVAVRSRQLKRLGIKAVHFGEMDKKDFLIPPVVLFYVYLIIANAFHFPKVGELLAVGPVVPWVGAALCLFAPAVFLWGIVSFGRSFRVGLDEDTPGALISSGAFARTRNPLYVAFHMILCGVFLIFPTWIFFCYFVGGLWLIDRQVCLEESSLLKTYGQEYADYCNKVRRYL